MIINLDYLNSGGGSGSGVTPAEVNTLIQSAITQGEYINNAEYISSAKTIVLYQDSTEVATIDATAFIKDGMVDSVTVSGSILTIVFNTDAGKEPINVDLSDVVDLSNYWTSAQTQSAINQASSGKQDTLTAGTGIDITNNVISATGGGSSNIVEVTQAEYDALVSGGTVDPDALYIISDASEVNLSGYALSSAVTAEIAAAVSGKADSSAVTQSLSSKQDTLVSGQNIKTVNNQSLLGSGNIDIQGGGATYSAGTNISIDTANTINCTLPITASTSNKNVSVGYSLNVREEGETSIGKFNVNRYESAIAHSGNTIFTVGNGGANNKRHNALEIRKNGDLYFADTSNNSQSYYQKPMVRLQDMYGALGGLKFVSLTQAEYDALVTKDSTTIYFIKNNSN